jgi:hypothetical protein
MIGILALFMLGQVAQPPAAAPFISEEIACAPISLAAPPVPTMRVVGGAEAGRFLFGPGEAVVVNAGRSQGVQTGQQYFVRRYIADRFTPSSLDFQPRSVHTAGWITIVDAKDTMAVARVTHACDGVDEGDYLEPFVQPSVPVASNNAAPDFGHPGRVVMADERRQMGYPGLVMLLNRGSDHGVRAGQGITFFRETLKGEGPAFTVGTGTIVGVTPQLSMVRVDYARDAVYVGDLAAIHRITQ